MNYYEARQLKTGGWHFTKHNKRTGTVPVGYCSDHGPHETREQAEECYKKYLLDQRLVFREVPNSMRKCQVCGTWTQGIAELDMHGLWVLCDEHRNRHEVEKLYKGPGQIFSSY